MFDGSILDTFIYKKFNHLLLVMETQGRLASVLAFLLFNESYVEDVPDSNSKPKRVKYEGWGTLPTGVRSWSPRLPPSILNQTFQEMSKDFLYNI
jgi:hypothetical protein